MHQQRKYKKSTDSCSYNNWQNIGNISQYFFIGKDFTRGFYWWKVIRRTKNGSGYSVFCICSSCRSCGGREGCGISCSYTGSSCAHKHWKINEQFFRRLAAVQTVCLTIRFWTINDNAFNWSCCYLSYPNHMWNLICSKIVDAVDRILSRKFFSLNQKRFCINNLFTKSIE